MSASLGLYGEEIGGLTLNWGSNMKKFMFLQLVTWIWICGVAHSRRPGSVNIGAVFAFDTVIGRAAKTAMEMAISDVNEDPTVLKGTKLNLIMKDAMCNAFLGSIGGANPQPHHFFVVIVVVRIAKY